MRVIRAVIAAQVKIRRWAIRLAAAYFGYKILHHEIYDVTSPEPLLIFLGLWLLGIAPADVFDGLRKAGTEIGKSIDRATGMSSVNQAMDSDVEQGQQSASTNEPESRSGDHQA